MTRYRRDVYLAQLCNCWGWKNESEAFCKVHRGEWFWLEYTPFQFPMSAAYDAHFCPLILLPGIFQKYKTWETIKIEGNSLPRKVQFLRNSWKLGSVSWYHFLLYLFSLSFSTRWSLFGACQIGSLNAALTIWCSQPMAQLSCVSPEGGSAQQCFPHTPSELVHRKKSGGGNGTQGSEYPEFHPWMIGQYIQYPIHCKQ